MFIKTGNQQAQIRLVGGIQRFIEARIMNDWGKIPNIDWDNTEGNAFAFVVRSSWVVGCPFCKEVSFAEPQMSYFCPSCLMGENKGRAVRVYFPKEWEEIEHILMKRGDPQTRNWLVDETLLDLKLENEEHGVV